MMKVYIEDQKMKYGREQEQGPSSSSSSTDEWKPSSPMEALTRLQMLSAQPAANVVFCTVLLSGSCGY